MGLWNRIAGAFQKKEVQAILVITLLPLRDAQRVLQQIIDEQEAMGHGIAPRCEATTLLGDWYDPEFVSATIHTEFGAFGSDVLKRTKVSTLQTPDGDTGVYYVLFDH